MTLLKFLSLLEILHDPEDGIPPCVILQVEDTEWNIVSLESAPLIYLERMPYCEDSRIKKERNSNRRIKFEENT